MAATFELIEVNGAASGSPPTGTATTTARTDTNWKNIDDATTAYSASPISAGNNSFDKWLAAHFSGSYNQISGGLWAHTATAFGAGLTLFACVTSNTGSYTTPATTSNTNLTVNITSAIAIGSGQAVLFGATSPQAASKASSTTSNPAYSEWLATQLITTTNAAPGDTANVTLTIQYSEN